MDYFLFSVLLLTHQLFSLMDLYHLGLKFYVYFRVWYDESSSDRGAMGEGSASTSSNIMENPAAKGVSGKGLRQR